MGRSCASKDQMGMREHPRSYHASGERVGGREDDFREALNYEMHAEGDSAGNDKWMQTVHPKKGALHKALHIPEDKKIPTSTLQKETHARSPLMKKRANLALRYRGD